MKIPPKVALQGDERKAEALRGFALSQLRILQKQMSFRELEQDSRKLVFEDGTRISISSVFGTDTISIYVPEVPVTVAPEEAAVEELPRASVSVLGGKHKQGSGRPKVIGCTEVPEMVWPKDKNPEEITRETNVPLFVEGGTTKYLWTIDQGEEGKDSKGYWFDEAYTLKAVEVDTNSPGFCDGDAGPDKAACEANGGTWRFEGSTVTLYADETVCGVAKIKVTDLCQYEVAGEVSFEETLKFSEENPTEIERDTDVLLQIVDGVPPFKWKVMGIGFSFNADEEVLEIETEEESVHLYVGPACSNALVIVEDACETVIDVELELSVEFDWKDPPSTLRLCAGDSLKLEVIGGATPFTWSIVGYPTLKLDGVYEEVEGLREMQVVVADEDTCGIVGMVKVVDQCESELMMQLLTPLAELAMVWGDLSDEYVDPDSTAVVYVWGGAPPYKWEVEGTDFSFPTPVTAEWSNILRAGPDSCGVAKITVTDCCGETCEGSVRSSEGSWALKGNYCGLSGSGELIDTTYYDWIYCAEHSFYYHDYVYTYELISGDKKQIQKTVRIITCTINGGPEVCGTTTEDCPEGAYNEWKAKLCDCWPGTDRCTISSTNCIDPDHTIPYTEGTCYEYAPDTDLWVQPWTCYGVSVLEYYEWECPA